MGWQQCSAVGGGAVCCGLQGKVQTLALILCAQPHCSLQAVEVKRFITESVKEGAKLVLWMQDMRQQTSVFFTLPARGRLMQIYLGYKKLFGHNLIIQMSPVTLVFIHLAGKINSIIIIINTKQRHNV